MTFTTVSLDTKIDLTNCDREPIHILGHVQQFGCLIAVTSDWLVCHASKNVESYLGKSAEDLIGQPIAETFEADGLSTIQTRVQQLDSADTVERLFGIQLMSGEDGRFNVGVHLSGRNVIIELEPHNPEQRTDYTSYVRPMIDRVRKARTVEELCAIAARQMKALTGFDRVMVYRFAEDQSGEVIAEAVSPNIDSFMGLHYPASDIPQQARELYRRNLLRIISDVNEKVSPILPERSPDGTPLDLSMSGLRAVSPIHIEYLKNMGVEASLSVSILQRDKLWGLFACHHYSPRVLPFEIRSAAELFAQLFSYVLGQIIQDTSRLHHVRTQKLHDQLMSQLAGGQSIREHFSTLSSALNSVVPNDGIAAWVDGEFMTLGRTPSRDEFMGIIRFLNTAAGGRIYATDHLESVYPRASDFIDRAAGLLAIPVSRQPRDYLVIFRQEITKTVSWAGNPEKPVTLGPNGPRLTPRKSFETWQETVHGQSMPWREEEIAAAEQLRATLLEVVLRMSDAANQERARANERQELLISELNHRVRNILNLIRGLVNQSAREAGSVEQLTDVIAGRVQALARAHDQLTQENWAPASLRALLTTEVSAYLGEKAARVDITGPDAMLMPTAFSTLALVMHEMVTNSAKYGALADSRGRVSISMSETQEGGLEIQWRESGGPAVQPPTRQGFGTTIIEKSIPHELSGTAEVRYVLTGLEADFTIPARNISSFSEGSGTASKAPFGATQAEPNGAGLMGAAMVLEDNMIIALDAEDLLHAAGASTVHVCATVEEALNCLSANEISFALLDINLGKETSEPVARELATREIPFILASGYGDATSLATTFPDVPLLKKPYDQAGLMSVLSDVLE